MFCAFWCASRCMGVSRLLYSSSSNGGISSHSDFCHSKLTAISPLLQEDSLLLQLVEKHGRKWSDIASEMQFRTAEQIRGRYTISLAPERRSGAWTRDEHKVLLREQNRIGMFGCCSLCLLCLFRVSGGQCLLTSCLWWLKKACWGLVSHIITSYLCMFLSNLQVIAGLTSPVCWTAVWASRSAATSLRRFYQGPSCIWSHWGRQVSGGLFFLFVLLRFGHVFSLFISIRKVELFSEVTNALKSFCNCLRITLSSVRLIPVVRAFSSHRFTRHLPSSVSCTGYNELTESEIEQLVTYLQVKRSSSTVSIHKVRWRWCAALFCVPLCEL